VGAASGSPEPIERVRAVEVYRNGYGSLYNDEVISPSGGTGHYLRWKWERAGVVVVPRQADRFGLVEMYRYPIGGVSLEFPRGGRKLGESIESAALRELQEETGFIGTETRILGRVHPDTGLIESANDVVSVEVPPDCAGRATPETMESIAGSRWLSWTEICGQISLGRITCGVTLSALALALSR
jgi:8-oxo-dGTP pyrophosphatase MutT (NUDIX family)